MKIYLVRHGETEWNKEYRLQGQADTRLNDYGRELAVITSDALQKINFDKIFYFLCNILNNHLFLYNKSSGY